MLELTLRAGDTLYLPRGWLHDALTSETDSLHVTVGVNVPPRSTPSAPRSTSASRTSSSGDRCPRTARSSGGSARAARGAPDRGGRARRRRAQFVDSRRPILDGHLEEVRELESVTVDTLLDAGRP